MSVSIADLKLLTELEFFKNDSTLGISNLIISLQKWREEYSKGLLSRQQSLRATLHGKREGRRWVSSPPFRIPPLHSTLKNIKSLR